MEFVRSDWSLLAKKFQYEIVRRVFYGENVKEYIELTIKDLEAGKLNDQLVLRKRLTKPIEEYVKNIPPHVKALRLLKEKLGIVKNRAEYVMTSRGAVPIELEHQDIDYDYYIEKQLMPVAQTILVLIGEDFNQFRNKQLSLF
jgi:DNA polymerase-2